MTSQSMEPIYQQVREQYLGKLRTEIDGLNKPPTDSELESVSEYIREKYHFNVSVSNDDDNEHVIVYYVAGEDGDQGSHLANEALSEMMEILNMLFECDFGDLQDYDPDDYRGSWTYELTIDRSEPEPEEEEEELKYEDFVALKDIKHLVHDIQEVCELIKDDAVKEEFRRKTLLLFKKYRDSDEDPAEPCEELLGDICEQHSDQPWCKKIIKMFS